MNIINVPQYADGHNPLPLRANFSASRTDASPRRSDAPSMAERRLHPPLALDVEPDGDELPNYEAATAPILQGPTYQPPLMTYFLRQVDRKQQILVPYGASAPSSYRLLTHSFRLFSKKPEMELLHAPPGTMREDLVATMEFDKYSPYPWRPRAHFSHFSDQQGRNTYAMEAANFRDWKFSLGDVAYVWRLETSPIRLVLSEQTADVAIARFTYSARGVLAMHGAEVGDLEVYPDVLSLETEGVEKIMSSMAVAILHFKNMGRNYKNEGPTRALSLSGETLARQRAASTASISNQSTM